MEAAAQADGEAGGFERDGEGEICVTGEK